MGVSNIFTPSASVSVTCMPPGSTAFPMPSVDAGNQSTEITNSGTVPALIAFGTSATVPVGVTVPGSITVGAGQSILLPTTHAAASATYAAALPTSNTAPAVLTVLRGTAAPQVGF